MDITGRTDCKEKQMKTTPKIICPTVSPKITIHLNYNLRTKELPTEEKKSRITKQKAFPTMNE
jgi:hypothetical protein